MKYLRWDRNRLSLILIIVFLTICNILFLKSKGWTRFGAGVLSYGALAVIYRLADLDLNDIGLAKKYLSSGLRYAAVAIGAIAVIFLSVYLIDNTIFNDSRYRHSLSKALLIALLVVPSQTVIFEELSFRGLLPAILKKVNNNKWFIYLSSSILFGLWHILTAPNPGDSNIGHESQFLLTVGVFVITSFAGAGFYYLRVRSKSLVAPILVHWFINSFAIVLAAMSWATH